MGGINKNFRWIHQFKFIALFQYARKDLLKQIRIFETAGIVFSKCREVRNFIHHFQTKKPTVCYIYLDFFHGLLSFFIRFFRQHKNTAFLI